VSDIEIKAALKEALKEWLDDRYAAIGKWTLGALAASALSAIAYAIITLYGYHK
jgi:hypothetical protein